LAFNSDMKIWIPNNRKVLCPDALVIAEKPKFYEARKDIITNPLLIVEVISPSSEAGDRGSKFHDYRTIPTFREYLLLRQDEALATLATCQRDDLWRMTDIQSLDQSIQLASIGCSIAMADLYLNIEF